MRISSPFRFLISGAVAGVASALAFMVIHERLISDIWFSIVPMLIAGAVSGALVAWSYRLMFERPTQASWWMYNGVYVGLLGLLGVASLVLYQPITTVGEVLASAEPPNDLIRYALPLSIGFTIASAALIQLVWGKRPLHFVAVLLTCTILIFLLGVNVSIIGLVELTTTGFKLVGLTFGLIVVLALFFALGLALLEWRSFRRAAAPTDAGLPPEGEPPAPVLESPLVDPVANP